MPRFVYKTQVVGGSGLFSVAVDGKLFYIK